MAHPPPYDPNFGLGIGFGSTEHDDHKHDSSVSAAKVAVNLISSVRTLLKLDSVSTEYSAQYLLDKAGANRYLTVKDSLAFALKEGIPKAEDWPVWSHNPSSSSNNSPPALVTMKGEVLEAKQVEDAGDLLAHLPVAAKLHVFSPQIDIVGDGIYCGSSGEAFGYVGLRDVIIVRVEKIQGKSIAIVKLWYKNKFKFVKVAMSRWFLFAPVHGFVSMERTGLLVDIVAPRLSIN